MDPEKPPKDWKLKLRQGKLKTPFKHYTVLAEGIVAQLSHGFSCPAGSAIMGMKTWSSSTEESANMLAVIGKQIGFMIKGRVQVFETEPSQAPRETAFGYDINFTPFNADEKN